MRYLLDTCVLSEVIKPEANEALADWLNNENEDSLYLSVLTFGEIQKGISALPDSRRRRSLQHWLDNDLRNRFTGRILAVDDHTATDWGILSGSARQQGMAVPVVDGLIAATARQYDLTLVTRNVSDFEHLGVSLINPWVE